MASRHFCPVCGGVLSIHGTKGKCAFCNNEVDLSSEITDYSSQFAAEPDEVVEPEEKFDEPLRIFSCPKCGTSLEGMPEKCPNCHINLKYVCIAEQDDIVPEKTIEETREEEPSSEAPSEPVEEASAPENPVEEETPIEEAPEAEEVAPIEIELEEPWPEHELAYVDNSILQEKKVVSIKRSIFNDYGDEEHFYEVTYQDGKVKNISSKGMKLNGLMARK